jgi:HEAT repeat protein
VGRAGRPELVDVLRALAEDKDCAVRGCVATPFFMDSSYGDTDLGDEGWKLLRELAADPSWHVRRQALYGLTNKRAPEWAMSVVLTLLSDGNALVRCTAIAAAAFIMRDGKGTELFPARIREILDSPTEDARARSSALAALCRLKLIDDDRLSDFASDAQERVAETARELIEERAAERKAEREEARDGSPPGE